MEGRPFKIGRPSTLHPRGDFLAKQFEKEFRQRSVLQGRLDIGLRKVVACKQQGLPVQLRERIGC